MRGGLRYGRRGEVHLVRSGKVRTGLFRSAVFVVRQSRCGKDWLVLAVFGWARSGSDGGVRTVRPSGVSSAYGLAVAIRLGMVGSAMVGQGAAVKVRCGTGRFAQVSSGSRGEF